MNTSKLFYSDKPLFGLDIGSNSIKVMQLELNGKQYLVNGYGVLRFDKTVLKDGAIVDYENLAKYTYELFDKHIIGNISTRRVAATIPASQAYTKVVSLPVKLSKKELDEAVKYEAEQYIPIPLEDLYMDYSLIGENEENKELLVVAVPRRIIDSYMKFFELVGLEVCMLETTISAASRLVARTETSNQTPTILIDLGSLSVDLTIYDKFLVVSGTVPGGGDDFSKRIAEKLKVTPAEANTIKMRYGLGISKKQAEIREALGPQLELLIKEIRRMIRYYEEHTEGKSKIGQIITMGGGANMPGLADYLTDKLRLPVRRGDFWGKFDLPKLEPPIEGERSVYITVAGAALIQPEEINK